ncbi:hypothetical protein DL96DRAFT_1714341 [Flagelloscypha sp. PMI_526]|nr:hypothetical protein DL96DRAFT_1714341 [Flagelloscypha sp. PMI_526]
MASEASIIRSIGLDMIQGTISLLIEGILWALVIQRRRGFINLGSKAMLVVTLYLFTASTALLVLNATWCFIKIKYILTTNLEMDWHERRRTSDHVLAPLGIPMEALFLFNVRRQLYYTRRSYQALYLKMLIGDMAVVFRAKILWGTGWKIVFLPVVFLVAATAFSITSVTCLSLSTFSGISSVATGSYVCKRAEPIAWALSLLTNLLSTLLVAYRAWAHRKVVFEAHGSTRRRSGVERILTLIVESGFIYLLFLLTQLALFWDAAVDSPARWAFAVLAPFGDQISGIYSTALIVFVVLQRTLGENRTIQTLPIVLGGDKTLTQIEFGSQNASAASFQRTSDV